LSRILALTASELKRLVPLDLSLVDSICDGFKALARGGVEMPPILSLRVPAHNGEIDVKSAYVPGVDVIAVKISPGFFDNPKLGLPSLNGLVVALDSATGVAAAILLDNGYLTNVRTAAAGAVAAHLLSRPESARVAIIGSGVQAEQQLRAVALVRPIRSAFIWSRRPEQAATLAGRLEADLGFQITAARDIETAVTGADIVITTTPAEHPVLLADHLAPGMHLTAMGADAPYKNEISPLLVARAQPYAPDRLAQCRILGELRSAIANGDVPADETFPELGQILLGMAPGRQSADAITMADLTGTGMQDTVIAALAVSRARAAGAGSFFETG
jgi:ectoine utilization protein EutC